MSTTSILDRFLEPVVEFLPADTARKIIDLRIDASLQERIDELAEKANQGTLSADEREEYAAYIEELDMIAILKLKAQAALRRHGPRGLRGR